MHWDEVLETEVYKSMLQNGKNVCEIGQQVGLKLHPFIQWKEAKVILDCTPITKMGPSV